MDRSCDMKSISPVDGGRKSESPDAAYFSSYGDVKVHELMIKDRPRTMAYKRFTETNKHIFINKTVLDVGAGTGILSLFAASAGARHVYAVEASAMSKACERIIRCNGMEDQVTVIHGNIEDIELPVSKVDIIISEWMGFYLFHEAMLDSVVFARDKWLSADGIMVPSHATLYLTPVNMDTYVSDHFKFWEDVYGYDFSPLQATAMVSALSQPVIECIEITKKISSPQTVIELDLKTASLEDLENIKSTLSFTVDNSSLIHGFAMWFDVDFKGPLDEENKVITNSVVLSTAPMAPPTHWKQTVIFLPSPFSVDTGEVIICRVNLAQDTTNNKRHYNISLEMVDTDDNVEDGDDENDEESEVDLDEDEEDHPMPCTCGSERCRLIAAIMSKFENEQSELENEAEFVDTSAEIEAAIALDAETVTNDEDLET